jgi:hypothetical protein
MTVSLTQLNNNNLLDLTTWTQDTFGSVTNFPCNGATNESYRYLQTDPWGNSSLVWETRPTTNGDADGGWEGSYVNIDNTKTYRYSVWVRRTSSSAGGTFYFGLHSNGTGDVYGLHDGSSNTNPYFDYRGTSWFIQNQWYLVVGHVFPASTATGATNAHPDSGVYTRLGGKIGSLLGNIPCDCRWGAGATQGMNRTYHYYCGDTTTRLQFFSPRIDVIDGNQPTIDNLLNNNLVPAANKPEGVKYNDGTVQSIGSTSSLDSGQLISMSAFTSAGTYTWTRPTGCTRIHVRVVGGGGGAAGYCEAGGAGGYSEKLIPAEGITSVTVTVGGGGSNTGYYAAAGNGGTSSFGSYLSASGGYGSNQNISHTGGYGGVGSGGDINLYGGTGTGHSNGHGNGGNSRGGSSYWGGASGNYRNNGGDRVGPGAPGNGGPGGRTDGNHAGGAGQAGAVIIWEYR